MMNKKNIFMVAAAALLALLFASCTADTVNVNGTYEGKQSGFEAELRLARGQGNAVNGDFYIRSSGDHEFQKVGDITGTLTGFSPIKFNYTLILPSALGGTITETGTADVLDYGNKIKTNDSEFIKKK